MATLVDEIRSWATTELKYWERAALDKVATYDEITDDEYTQLVTFFLEDAGLLQAPDVRPKLSFPENVVYLATLGPCRLERIFNLKNVNALPEGQELQFGKQLTLIYGENGAGKTGYTRPLGCAAFARGDREVLPDATSPGPRRTPQADIQISYGSSSDTLHWTHGERLAELAGFYVFDGNSLLAHLTGANPLSFSPFGLSLLTRLAEVTDQVRARVRSQIEQREIQPTFHLLFQGHSEVAKLMTNVGVHTDLNALDQLSQLSVEEQTEAGRLEKEIASLKLLDIAKEMDRRRQEIQDLEMLIMHANEAHSALDATAAHEINRLITDLQSRKIDAETFGTSQFASASFIRVGGTEWRTFVAAAKALAEIEEQQKNMYPQPGDSCLLCQQKLSGDAAALIQRLWEFLRSDPQARLEAAQAACDARIRELEHVSLHYLGADSSVRHLLQDELPLAITTIDAQIAACEARRQSFLEALRSCNFSSPPPMIEIDYTELLHLAEVRRQDIKQLQQSDVGQRLTQADNSWCQLKHRQLLGEQLPAVRTCVEGTRWAARARQSLGTTKAITTKYNELFTKLVTEKYTNAFETTLHRFRKGLRVTVETRGHKGETVRQIALRSESFAAGYSVDRILSDGEKRAAAIADFLTEVSMDQSNSGIILDDPVTSFADGWKDTLAQCLAEEAARRQVIIFTHDLTFLYYLKARAEELSIDVKTHWIRAEDERPGFVYLDNSPVCEKDYKSADMARRNYSEAKVLPPGEQQGKLQQGFGALRTSYEALVIFEMFGDVVSRWQERISFDRLQNVRIDSRIVDDVIKRMVALSRHIDAHLHSDKFAATKPTPADLFAEIEAFEAIRNRQKQLKKISQP